MSGLNLKRDIVLPCGIIIRDRSIRELDLALRKAEKRKDWPRRESVRGAIVWSGGSVADAHRYFRSGLPVSEQGTEELEGLVSDSYESWQLERDVCGAFPHVPAYLAGQPDCMLNVRRRDSERARRLTLVYHIGYSWSVETDTIHKFRNGLNKLVAWLNAQRITCDVVAINAVKLGNHTAYYVIPVQSASMALQPERIAMTLHPVTFRRGWFAMLEYEAQELDLPGCMSAVSNRYGFPVPLEIDKVKQALKAYNPESIVMLPSVEHCKSDPENAIRKAINLKLKPER